MRLDDLLGKCAGLGRSQARTWIGEGTVTVDALAARDPGAEVDRFARVLCRGQVIQAGSRRVALLLHKPAGVVTATVDAEFPTVMDLIDHPQRGELFPVGRLDRATTGLLLLTNDGRWAQPFLDPATRCPKVYLAALEAPHTPAQLALLASGSLMLHGETAPALPAMVQPAGPCAIRLTLVEGRHHQAKKMVRAAGNRIVALHREAVGEFRLPPDLAPGQWRELDLDLAKWPAAGPRAGLSG